MALIVLLLPLEHFMNDSPLIIGSRQFQSRLLVGTGKYKDLTETEAAITASYQQRLRAFGQLYVDYVTQTMRVATAQAR